MAYPTGTGSEVLKRTTINAQEHVATAFRWDGTQATTGTSSYTVPALHIITVLSVIICDNANNDRTDIMYMYDDAGGDNIYLMQAQPIAAYETFVWNDKFVLQGGDKLVVNTSAAGANHDFLCTFIDQNWEN